MLGGGAGHNEAGRETKSAGSRGTGDYERGFSILLAPMRTSEGCMQLLRTGDTGPAVAEVRAALREFRLIPALPPVPRTTATTAWSNRRYERSSSTEA